MAKSNYNYEEDIVIDKFSLDREWVNQSVLYMTYSVKAADADSDYRKAKENLDVVQAQVYKEERQELEQKEGKTTEAQVNNAVTLNKKFQTAKAAVDSALYEVAIYNAAVKAFDQRKKALENLVQLYLSGYWSAPKSKAADEMVTASASDKARKKLNKKS